MSLAAEDELAILRLLTRYAQAVSRQDLESILALFTPEGIWERKVGASAGKYTAQDRVEGREALRAFTLKNFELQGEVRYQYVAANAVISGNGQQARGVSTLFIFGMEKATVSVILIGNFDDEYRKTADGWQFSYRGMSVRT